MAPCPPAVPGAVQFDPPPVYVLWWREASECADAGGDYRMVRWFVVGDHASWYFPCMAGYCAGMWRSPHDIYIAGRLLMFAPTVKHEILHELRFMDHGHRVFSECAR